MKTSELKEKSVEELNGALIEEYKSQFKLRMQLSTGQLEQTHLLKQNRRDIARIKTLLKQKVDA